MRCNVELKDVVSMNAGLVLTRKRYQDEHAIKGYEKHTYPLLNLHSIDDYGNIIEEKMETFESFEDLDSQYLTQEGMLLVRVNYPYTCTYIRKEDEGYVIPSYFIVLDEVKDDYDPIFLSWYLNSKRVKHEFERMQSGTLVPSINQKILSELKLPHYSKEKQKELNELYVLLMKERRLYQALMKEKEKYYDAIEEIVFKEEK